MKPIVKKNYGTGIMVITLILMLAAGGSALAAGAGRSGQAALTGRDFTRLGTVTELSGVLEEERGEWYLRNSDGRFSLHMGPHEYLSAVKVELKEGADVRVKGWQHNQDVSVGLLVTDGKSVVLRDETGQPAWSGTKFSQGRNRGQGVGRGLGNRQGYRQSIQ